MKKILLLVLFFTSLYAFAQKTEACKCDLLKQSQDSIRNYYSNNEFTPVPEETVLKPRYSFISVKYLDKYASSADIVDSLEIKINQAAKNKVPHLLLGSSKIRDSITRLEFSKKYGGIPKPLIIKTGTIKKVKGILYTINNNYYLKVSKDNGKTWKTYFTGLKVKDHYYFKSNSRYPLWKDNQHIQIEADIVRLVRLPKFRCSPEPQFEKIKNNALVTLNLKEIMKDSDQDGFNDLEEKFVLFTNPKSKDTDNDGIIDSKDSNPKYKSVNNDFTKLVQAILYGDYTFLEDSDPHLNEFIINLKTFDEDMKKQQQKLKSNVSDPRDFSDSFDFNILVSDDENFRRIKPLEEKILFLTSKEFQSMIQLSFLNSFTDRYSKIYPCDEKPDTYILVFNGITRGETYLITRISEGWRVKIIDSWLS